MTKYLRFIIIILAVASSSAFASKNTSLYNAKNAEKLNLKDQSLFGPQSSKFRYDKRMIRAAQIAAARAKAHSTSRCWRFVKKALLASDVIDSYPKTAYAKQAAVELTRDYGFERIKVSDPYKAPVGSVIVYGGRGAGHVEIRTQYGFVSDFSTSRPSPRPLLGVFVKPKA